MRNALASTLYALAKKDERIVVIVADISPAGAMEDFKREFPARFINVGVAEQSMIGLAAGLAQRGFKPFCYTIATFALFRAYEFIRCDLAYQNLPVTVVGMGAGLSYSTLGGTHQAIEDVAVAMACPNLTVLAPCDPAETVECVSWCAGRKSGGPVYMRIGKAGEPDMPRQGRGTGWFWMHAVPYATETVIVSHGVIAAEALTAARRLRANAISICMLAPLPDAVVRVLGQYENVVVIEEASGAPLAGALRAAGLNAKSFALPRTFPHAHGTRAKLLARAGLTADTIVTQLRGED